MIYVRMLRNKFLFHGNPSNIFFVLFRKNLFCFAKTSLLFRNISILKPPIYSRHGAVFYSLTYFFVTAECCNANNNNNIYYTASSSYLLCACADKITITFILSNYFSLPFSPIISIKILTVNYIGLMIQQLH
jgi:hypothetical protein